MLVILVFQHSAHMGFSREFNNKNKLTENAMEWMRMIWDRTHLFVDDDEKIERKGKGMRRL